MGAGKTTIGKRLSNRLQIPFFDTDKMVEQQEGMSITQIFDLYSDNWFRQKEREILNALSLEENAVISTGGGTPCYGDNMDFLLEHGIVIYLWLPVGTIVKRLEQSKKERPLVRNFSSSEELSRFVINKLSERQAFYQKAHITVDAMNYNLVDILQNLIEQMKTTGNT